MTYTSEIEKLGISAYLSSFFPYQEKAVVVVVVVVVVDVVVGLGASRSSLIKVSCPSQQQAGS